MQQEERLSSVDNQARLSHLRRKRVLQISAVTALGLFTCLFFARGITFTIFLIGFLAMATSAWLASRHHATASSYILLISLSTMLFALSATGAGTFDLAMLGYPGVIIFAALLGGRRLFWGVLSFVILQCIALTWLILEDYLSVNTPYLSWSHLVFILVIFCVIGFGVYVLVQDIRQLLTSLQSENAKVEENRQQIQHLAHHDPLTNLPNRVLGERLFKELLTESTQDGKQLALLFIDLDNFKPVNDALGHAAGDRFLQKLAQTMTDHMTENERIIRFGGDEFIVLASGIRSEAQLNALCDNIISWCSTEFELLQTKIVVSCSIGIARAPQDGNQFKQLCRKADVAMYEAKRSGRNGYTYYDASFDVESDEKFTLIQRLRPAVQNNEFEVYYQPLIDLNTGTICAIEALLRWPQKDGSMIFPDKFIPLAESSGLITQLGEWVLEEACQFCAYLYQQGTTEISITVNLSFAQFKDGSLPHAVAQALDKSELDPQHLELELTESIIAESARGISKQLKEIRDLGVRFAIDDFGTGYSNLSYLQQFKAQKLKIDRVFIEKLNETKNSDEDGEPLVSAIINIAKSIGMKTVAEGIEDAKQLQKLVTMGCDIGQGYHWSKPVPQKEIEALITSHIPS
jgi:diguanylate cyclase (GGDEF)-like protein